MSTLDAPPVLHPLEPLSAAEISAASAILKAEKGLAPTARFVFVSLHEPPKAAVQAGRARCRARRSSSSTRRPSARPTRPSSRSPTRPSSRCEHIEGVQAPVMAEEFMACEEVVQSDPTGRRRCAGAGSRTSRSRWSTRGPRATPGPRTTRPSAGSCARSRGCARSRASTATRGRSKASWSTVDLDAMEVIGVDDHGVVPLPPQPGNYDVERMAAPDNVPRSRRRART